MGKFSSIQWCHSSLNLQMGCDGCELWTDTIRKCYAGRQTAGLAGHKGWPERFDLPKLFLDRLPEALKWGAPTEKEREAKPWMPRTLPRLIFLNDMGDTFSRELPLDWMAPLLPAMGASPHRFLLLTKRPSRMAEFSQAHPFPENFWLGTSVTSQQTVGRLDQLRKVRGGSVRFVSFEPLWSAIPSAAYAGLDWAIFGGESGDPARGDTPERCELGWIEQGVMDARLAGARPLVKQLGSNCHGGDHGEERLRLRDGHGGDWTEWPEELRVREFPEGGARRAETGKEELL